VWSIAQMFQNGAPGQSARSSSLSESWLAFWQGCLRYSFENTVRAGDSWLNEVTRDGGPQ